jgi:hypothetical protein
MKGKFQIIHVRFSILKTLKMEFKKGKIEIDKLD